jgi:hypothetical protein
MYVMLIAKTQFEHLKCMCHLISASQVPNILAESNIRSCTTNYLNLPEGRTLNACLNLPKTLHDRSHDLLETEVLLLPQIQLASDHDHWQLHLIPPSNKNYSKTFRTYKRSRTLRINRKKKKRKKENLEAAELREPVRAQPIESRGSIASVG